ncbi:unnamed protein product, partial [Effrenium voratum]
SVKALVQQRSQELATAEKELEEQRRQSCDLLESLQASQQDMSSVMAELHALRAADAKLESSLDREMEWHAQSASHSNHRSRGMLFGMPDFRAFPVEVGFPGLKLRDAFGTTKKAFGGHLSRQSSRVSEVPSLQVGGNQRTTAPADQALEARHGTVAVELPPVTSHGGMFSQLQAEDDDGDWGLCWDFERNDWGRSPRARPPHLLIKHS